MLLVGGYGDWSSSIEKTEVFHQPSCSTLPKNTYFSSKNKLYSSFKIPIKKMDTQTKVIEELQQNQFEQLSIRARWNES